MRFRDRQRQKLMDFEFNLRSKTTAYIERNI